MAEVIEKNIICGHCKRAVNALIHHASEFEIYTTCELCGHKLYQDGTGKDAVFVCYCDDCKEIALIEERR